jgi:hypothetical protein
MTLQFVKFEFVTLIGTWWGVIGCLLGPVFILSNLDEYISGGFFIMRDTARLRLRGRLPLSPQSRLPTYRRQNEIGEGFWEPF